MGKLTFMAILPGLGGRGGVCFVVMRHGGGFVRWDLILSRFQRNFGRGGFAGSADDEIFDVRSVADSEFSMVSGALTPTSWTDVDTDAEGEENHATQQLVRPQSCIGVLIF